MYKLVIAQIVMGGKMMEVLRIMEAQLVILLGHLHTQQTIF